MARPQASILALMLCFLWSPALAWGDLQNVTAGGDIIVLGEYYRNAYPAGDGVRWEAPWLRGRPVGVGVGAGNPLTSGFAFDDGNDLSLVTQYTRLTLKADFTDGVAGFVSFDSVAEWGEDFRSDYVSGADARAATGDDVEVYEAWVEAAGLFGVPLRLRLGRQELRFGGEWLVGANDCAPVPVWGLSFDAVRLTFTPGDFTIDAFWAKLAERVGSFGAEDTDFYGLYASYGGVEGLALDAYWLFLRDDETLEDVAGGPAVELAERLFGVDDYGPTALHTLGVRAAGTRGPFDFAAEAAWQFGDADRVGARFVPVRYGDDDADFDAWALHLEAGYTFDTAWAPRVYGGYAFFEGEDRRGGRPLGWLRAALNPFYTSPASVSFNRLFSNWSYSALLDGSELSNVHIARAGLSAAPAERLTLALDVGWFVADETFDAPVPGSGGLLTREGDEDLGWELALGASYQYSEDLYLAAGWARFFPGEGLEDGSFTAMNGLGFNGAADRDGADYFWVETGIGF